MTRNLRTQLADQAEHALRAWFGDDLCREDAGRYLPKWRFAIGLDDELRQEVLSRFSPAEPPAVAGMDFLPAVVADAQTIVAETVAEPCAPLSCLLAPIHAGVCEPRTPSDRGAEGADAEVKPEPAPQVWDDSVPPGGFVCSACRTPVESEPCSVHGEVVEGEVTSPFGPCSGLDPWNNTCENFAAEFVEWEDDLYGTQVRRLCTPCADLLRNVVSRRPLTHGPGGVPVERAR